MVVQVSPFEIHFVLSGKIALLSSTVVFLYFGSWNLRKAILAGQKQAYNYYLDRMMENVTITARQVVKKAGSGDIADWIFINDLNGYTLKEQGCVACEFLL
jgi:hypothetical protein